MGSRGFIRLTILCVMFAFLCLSIYFSTRFLLIEDRCSGPVMDAHPEVPLSTRLDTLTNDEFTARYISSSSYQFAKKKGVVVGRMKILIAVITTEKYLLTRAQVIHKTWGQDIGSNNKLYFFVGEHSNTSHPDLKDLPIIKMKGLRDDVYPPMEKAFGILEHLYLEYGDRFRWFVRADDDVYIRVDKLEAMLDGLRWTDNQYLGLPGFGVESYREVLKLLPKESYCMGGPSITWSAAGLKALYPYLRKCLNAALAYNLEVPKDMGWYYDDVELGRCASRTLGMRCSRGSKVMPSGRERVGFP